MCREKKQETEGEAPAVKIERTKEIRIGWFVLECGFKYVSSKDNVSSTERVQKRERPKENPENKTQSGSWGEGSRNKYGNPTPIYRSRRERRKIDAAETAKRKAFAEKELERRRKEFAEQFKRTQEAPARNALVDLTEYDTWRR
jgi:hypothetical protein